MQAARLLSPCQAMDLRQCLKYLIISSVLIFSALGVIYSKHRTRILYATLQQLQHKRDALHIEWSQLLLEKGTWANDARVERIAREKLGMDMPAVGKIVVIKP